MPVGNGVVLMGMSERTSRQAIPQVAASLFEPGRGRAGGRRRHAEAALRDAPGHVFTFADRDIVTVFPRSGPGAPFSLRPDRAPASRSWKRATPSSTWSPVAGAAELRVIETGGDVYAARAPAVGQRQQLGRRRARCRVHLRPQHADQHPAAQGGLEVIPSSAPSSVAAAAAATA